MNDTLLNIFKEAMQRERKIVTTFTSNEEFECFFRRNNDGINQKNTIIMYYDVAAPIHTGTLVCYKDEIYLALNKETVENDIYYKSALIKTNGTVNNTFLKANNLPLYGDNINNGGVTSSNNLSIVDGNLEVLTEDGVQSRSLKIDDTFIAYGRNWKIENIYHVDGITHLILGAEAFNDTVYDYSLELTALKSYDVVPGESDKLTAIAYCNDIETEATIIYSSSNEDIATIDDVGNIQYISEGDVVFTAKWSEQNIVKETETVNVVTLSAGDEIKIYVQNLDEICFDFPETLNYYVTCGGVRDDSISVKFKIENISVTTNYNTYFKKIIVTDNGDNTINLAVNGSSMVEKAFDLVAYIEDSDIENRQNIKVTSFF